MPLPQTPYKRSLWFAMLFVLLIVLVAAVAAFMSTRSAERSMRVQVERTLTTKARDAIADLRLWYAALRAQTERLAASDVFRLFASETFRIGEHKAANLSADVRNDAEGLAARVPFMRKLLQDFVSFTEFESARILDAGLGELLSAGYNLAPLTAEQQDAAAQVLRTGEFTVITQNTPAGLVLEFFEPIYAPGYVENDVMVSKAPVAVLQASRSIRDWITKIEQDGARTEGGSARLLSREGTSLRLMRPDKPLSPPLDWALVEDEVPMSLQRLPVSGKAAYIMGLPVSGLPWVLVQAVAQETAEAAFHARRTAIVTVAVTSAAMVLLVLSVLWWVVVGRRDRAFTRALHDLHETVNRQTQLLASLDAAVPAGLALCDAAGRLRQVNRRFATLTGHSSDSLPGLAMTPLFADEPAGELRTLLDEVMASGEERTLSLTLSRAGQHAEDEALAWQVLATPYRDGKEHPAGVIFIFQPQVQE